jgi:GR25 family glycosyltransferase involved in LPS biosynthesis
MEGVDVIYWINLKQATERRKHMETILRDPAFDSIEKIRMNAVDANNAMKKFTIPVEDVLSVNHRVTGKEYACLASHLDTIRMFSKSKFETAIILEDDVSLDLKPYWRKTIQKLMDQAPPDWDILRLHHGDVKQKEAYAKLTYPCYSTKFPRFNPQCKWGTISYLIHKRAALKLMRLWNGKTYQLPTNTFHVADYFLYDLLTTYSYKYPYFLDRKDNDTQIQPEQDRIQNNRTRRIFLSKMKTRKH